MCGIQCVYSVYIVCGIYSTNIYSVRSAFVQFEFANVYYTLKSIDRTGVFSIQLFHCEVDWNVLDRFFLVFFIVLQFVMHCFIQNLIQ